jgi:predicted DNA-binding transcriptional regulator YafY
MRAGEPVPLLPAIHDGVVSGRRLDLNYRDSEARDRQVTVDPIGLVAKAGVWYLITADPALFRVSRVRSCVVRPEPAVRPDGLDLARTWAALRERVEVRPRDLSVTITVRADALGRVRRVLAAHLRAGEPAGPVLHLTFAGVPHAVGSLLGFGTQIEVREPASVRAALAAAARSVLDLYRV